MFGINYYYGLTRKFVSVFGTLFNDIVISRPYTDGANTEIQSYKVPITYGSQDKLLARVNTDPDLTRQIAAKTPAMSFIVGAPVYDSTRAIAATQQRTYITANGVNTQFVGVPYNLDFQLFIYADQEEDGLRVVENIIPYFTPSLSVVVKLIPEMNYEINVPIVLNSIDFQNDSWGSETKRRKLIWTLNFTMQTQFTGPIDSSKSLIKQVIVNFYSTDVNDSNSTHQTVTVQPGLTANGQPTSNVSQSISYLNINSTDDFGYIETITGNQQ